jgi:hypothetical protein
VITDPNGTSVTLAGGFTVEQGGAPQISVDIIGRNQIRIGQAQTYYVLLDNKGNVDSSGEIVSVGVPTATGNLFSSNGPILDLTKSRSMPLHLLVHRS